jgi:predicted TIM-barrel fold metal-dependent hydrolase
MWATDYPHPDHPHTWVDDLTVYAKRLNSTTRSKVLGENVKRIYKLDYELPERRNESLASG